MRRPPRRCGDNGRGNKGWSADSRGALFGDQFFWGEIVCRAGAGPRPMPYRSLSTEALAEAIEAALRPDAQRDAERLAECIKSENGVEGSLQHIYAHLPIDNMTCMLDPSRVAVWRSKTHGVRMSAAAATVLRKERLVDWSDLTFYRPMEHHASKGPFEPVSGAMWAVTELIYDSLRGMGEIIAEFPHAPVVGHRVLSGLNNKLKSRCTDDSETNEDGLSSYRVVVTDKVSVEHPISEQAKGKSKRHKFLGEYMFIGATRIGKAAARAPGTFTAGMAQGAHNMPLVWGDSTVRPAANVGGVGTGMVEGCKELVLGVYDGISGLFIQPIFGLIEDGPVGFVKGAGKGVLGLPVKFFAAASGIVGYPLKGIDAAITHAFKTDGMKAVQHQRMLQGEHEYVDLPEETKKEIARRWQLIVAKERT